MKNNINPPKMNSESGMKIFMNVFLKMDISHVINMRDMNVTTDIIR